MKKTALKDVMDSAKRLLDYNNEILDFQKYEANYFHDLQAQFNYKEIVEDVIKMNIPATKIKNIELSADLPLQENILIGDAQSFKIILINLLGNAIKFTVAGYVKIVIQFETLPQWLMMNLMVEDTGIGIPKDKQEIIFDKFVRLSPSYSGIYKGTGLGLAIVKKSVEKMQGTIKVDSDLGQGAKFICKLPFRFQVR
jgi:signal transduction histidine kinase